MAKAEFEDFIIAAGTARLQLTESQRELIEKHRELLLERLEEAASPLERMMAYHETMIEVEGAEEVYGLLVALTDWNLGILLDGLKQ